MIICPIHESNDCHTPPGSSDGGQFCSNDAEIVGGGTMPIGDSPAGYIRWGRVPKTEYEQGSRWYSFPETGGNFTARRVKSVDLDSVADALTRADSTEGQVGVEKALEKMAPEPPAGYEVVYRIGGKEGELAGFNAANARGLTEFIYQMTNDGDLSIPWGFSTQQHKAYINIYFAKIGSRDAKSFGAGGGGGFKRGAWGR